VRQFVPKNKASENLFDFQSPILRQNIYNYIRINQETKAGDANESTLFNTQTKEGM
jgi:hypothetical protein